LEISLISKDLKIINFIKIKLWISIKNK